MKVIVTGSGGLLGQKLIEIFRQESDHEVLGLDIRDSAWMPVKPHSFRICDIANKTQVKEIVREYQPDAIINTAALTDVDACETDREFAWKLNVDAVKNLLIAARVFRDCHVIQVSTDYVFDGKTPPYDEGSRPNPLSYYGKSKLAAENAMMSSSVTGTIVRTQVLYGTGFDLRTNFVQWVLHKLNGELPFQVVNDQRGNPTYADDLAYALLKIVEKKRPGLYHVSGPEVIDRYAFARRIAEVFEFPVERIQPTTSEELNQPANRPMDSSFVTLKFESEFGYRLSSVVQGLRRLRFQMFKTPSEMKDAEHYNNK
jgi:dTDP-4-dehydrorhamnose reductase